MAKVGFLSDTKPRVSKVSHTQSLQASLTQI